MKRCAVEIANIKRPPGPLAAWLEEAVELGVGTSLRGGCQLDGGARISPGVSLSRAVIWSGARVTEDLRGGVWTARGWV